MPPTSPSCSPSQAGRAPGADVEFNGGWQPLQLNCKIAPQHRLTSPASGAECTHLACCNYDQLRAIVANSTHARRPTCPVSGCTSRIRLERDIVIDEQLQEALRPVPAEVSVVEVCQTAAGGPYTIRWQAPSGCPAAFALDTDAGEVPSLPPPKKLKREPPQAGQSTSLVSEADGLVLHLNPDCASGYKGVYLTKSGRFEVRLSHEGVHLGTHNTAIEAAVVYACHLLSRE